MSRWRRVWLGLAPVSFAAFAHCTHAEGPEPAGAPFAAPLGYDVYRDWDRWATLRLGTRTYMRSTFDRTGGNEGADASHFLRDSPRGLVALDMAGPGVLTFVRTNRWHGSPWSYTIDGRTTVVSESATADPDHPPPSSTFLPEPLFPSPLALTSQTTAGADLSWVRIPFERSLELAYGRSHYGTGYYIVQTVAEGSADTSVPLVGWDGSTAPPGDVLDLIGRAGTDIAPTAGLASASGQARLAGGGQPTLITKVSGPGTIRALRFTIPRDAAAAFEHASLRITWDDRAAPSVDAPVPLFFGAGTLWNRDGREWLVKALPVSIHFPPGSPTIELATYFPMPFTSGARVELVSNEPIDGVGWEARWLEGPPRDPSGYLHATFRDHGVPVPGQDLVLLDTQDIEGANAWCGTVVGTSFIFSDRAVLGTLEGDPRFFFDESLSPQVQGTGTEEWGGGGDYWNGGTLTTLPFAGHPVGAPSAASAQDPRDLVESAYRYLLGDAMPFGRNAKLGLEHGGLDESTEHYQSVAYWYGWPEACLVLADALDVGNVDDERRHGYAAVGAADPYSVTSRYEVGVDHVGDKEIVPTSTDTGREIATSSDFVVDVPPDNVGLLLRRTLDYAEADQRADVFVADADDPNATLRHAGVWYVAGSSRVLYANASTETGTAPPQIEDSGRRWRDDELLVARKLTQGMKRVRIHIAVTPGAPWTEFHYGVYAWTIPPGWRGK